MNPILKLTSFTRSPATRGPIHPPHTVPCHHHPSPASTPSPSPPLICFVIVGYCCIFYIIISFSLIFLIHFFLFSINWNGLFCIISQYIKFFSICQCSCHFSMSCQILQLNLQSHSPGGSTTAAWFTLGLVCEISQEP